MRKILTAIFVFVFANFLSSAEVFQSLVPPEVYVGDVAELRYNFTSAADFFSEVIGEKKIDVQFENLSETLAVKSCRFVQSENQYAIILQFVPWRQGRIEFPVFDLFSALGLNEDNRKQNVSYEISLEPIEVKSIVEKTGRSEIQPPLPPFMIPGTSYIIFAFAVVAIILLVLLLHAIIKFGELKRWISNVKIRRAYRRNSIIAMRKIKRLLRTPSTSDIEFCASLQNITRSYLSFRFDYPFASASARAVSAAFDKICFGDVPAIIAESVDGLTSMFIRTDYIRYAHDSIDSQRKPQKEHQAKLAVYERKLLAGTVVKAIKVFESDGQKEGE